MTRQELQLALDDLDSFGIYVFTKKDLRQRFPTEPIKTFEAALSKHCRAGLLAHVCRSVYLNPRANSRDSFTLEHIAKALRRGEYTYVSLESLLSEQGVISQVPLSVLTLMTTGRSQTFKTDFGRIEFTHTRRSIADILKNTVTIPGRPLKMATVQTALKDLKRVNRNLDLIDNNQPQGEHA